MDTYKVSGKTNVKPYDTGMGTTVDMWKFLSEELTKHEIKLPDSLNKAIYRLAEDDAYISHKE